MAVPYLMIASIVAQAMDRERQQAAARKNAQSNLRAQYAADMGAPGYGYQAAQTNQKIEGIQGTNYLRELLPLLQKQQRDEDDDEDT